MHLGERLGLSRRTTAFDVHWFTFVCMNALSPTVFLISCSMRDGGVGLGVAKSHGALGERAATSCGGGGDGVGGWRRGRTSATRTSLMSVSISSTVTSWSSERPEMRPSSSGTSAATIVAGALGGTREPFWERGSVLSSCSSARSVFDGHVLFFVAGVLRSCSSLVYANERVAQTDHSPPPPPRARAIATLPSPPLSPPPPFPSPPRRSPVPVSPIRHPPPALPPKKTPRTPPSPPFLSPPPVGPSTAACPNAYLTNAGVFSTASVRHRGVDVLQEVIHVTRGHPEEVDNRRRSERDEKINSTHGRYGAVNENSPRKDICT